MSQFYSMILPIVPGKLEQFKQFAHTLLNDKRRDYEASRHQLGIRREMLWHQVTPAGDMAILVMELEHGMESFMQTLINPQDDFSRYFAQQASEIHGWDPSQLADIKPNEQIVNWHSSSLFEKANETALGIGQNLAGTAQDLLGKASQTAGEVGQHMASNTQEILGRAQTMAEEAGHKMQQQAQDVRKTVEAQAADMLHKASDNVAQATQQMQAKASEALENAAGVGQMVSDKASGLFNQALNIIQKKDKEPDQKS